MKQTFLEWLLTELIGLPISCQGNGESTWECPMCGSEKFHTLPLKNGFKHRAKCWHCGFRGDEADMLRLKHPDENYGDLLNRLSDLRRKYEKASHAAKSKKPQQLFSPGGRGGVCEDEDGVVLDEQSNLNAAETQYYEFLEKVETNRAFAYQLLASFRKVCRENDCTMEGLLKSWHDTNVWHEKMTQRYLAEHDCNDPENYDDAPCREMRGLPPLTPAEIRKRDADEKRAQEIAHAEKVAWIRRHYIKRAPQPGGKKGKGSVRR